jgi:hypothetical protein
MFLRCAHTRNRCRDGRALQTIHCVDLSTKWSAQKKNAHLLSTRMAYASLSYPCRTYVNACWTMPTHRAVQRWRRRALLTPVCRSDANGATGVHGARVYSTCVFTASRTRFPATYTCAPWRVRNGTQARMMRCRFRTRHRYVSATSAVYYSACRHNNNCKRPPHNHCVSHRYACAIRPSLVRPHNCRPKITHRYHNPPRDHHPISGADSTGTRFIHFIQILRVDFVEPG